MKLGLSRLVDDHPLSEGVVGDVFYTPVGVGLLYERMAREVASRGGTVLRGTRVVRVCGSSQGVDRLICETEGSEVEIDGDAFISTMPLPLLAEAMQADFSCEAVEAARNLSYRAIGVAGFLINRPQVRSAYLTYYPKKVFNRLSEPKNHGLCVCPVDHTVLLAERVCGAGDAAFKGDDSFMDAVVEDLVDEGLVDEEEIVERHHLAWEYAYPVYRLGYLEAVKGFSRLADALGNLTLAGRHGEFKYVNMHVAMDMGLTAAHRIAEQQGQR